MGSISTFDYHEYVHDAGHMGGGRSYEVVLAMARKALELMKQEEQKERKERKEQKQQQQKKKKK